MHTSDFWKPKSITLFYFLKYDWKMNSAIWLRKNCKQLQNIGQWYSLMCHDNLLIFLPIFSAQDKNSLSILSCHFLSIKKIRKKLLNIFRNLFLQYISCTVIWILNFKNCSKLNAKCWQHVRSIYYQKPRSKNHPWINV